MIFIELVTVLALLQYLFFGLMVAQARGKFGVKAPATTGHEQFERAYRVQMNTLEVMVIFIPALWLASRYWSPVAMSGIGAVYLVGRVLYFRAYTKDPASRGIGFGLSLLPAVALIVATLAGIGLTLLHGN
jgi:uncharacterized MAPEG superfamily protein